MSKDKPKRSAAVSAAARAMAQKRWAKVSKAERHRLMVEAGKKGGRPRSLRRCFCGRFTMRRAASRRFDCCRAAGVLKLRKERG